MKRFILDSIAILLMAASTEISSAQVGHPSDTIRGRELTYFYNDWLDEDMDCSKSISGGEILGEVARYFVTDTTLPVIGAAACVITRDFTAPLVADTSLEGWVDYMRLYKHVPGGEMLLLAEGAYTLRDTARMMWVSGSNYLGNRVEWQRTDTFHFYLPIYEVYFDKAYNMTDSFYVSVAGIHNIVDRESHQFPRWPVTQVAWGTHRCLQHRQLIAYRSNYTHEWDWWQLEPWYIYWIWPIIDTTGMNYIAPCDTFFCAGVSDLHVGHPNHVCGGIIDFVWTGAAEHSRWQLSYGPAGTMPGEGTVLDCSTPTVDVYGMQDSVHYVCYVRGYCDMCHKWGDWSEGFEYWKEMYTQPAEIRPGLLDRCITVMPNPASRYVSVMSSFRIGRIEAFDLQGNKVDEQPVDALNATLDLSLWPRGTYILNIRTNRGTVARTVVVQ